MATKMKKLVQAASLPDGRAKNEFLKDKVEVIQCKQRGYIVFFPLFRCCDSLTDYVLFLLPRY